jgi:hypothetical protein
MSEPASLSVASELGYLEITFRRGLSIWWAYFWRHIFYGGVALLIVEALERLVGLGGPLVFSLTAVLVMATVSLLVLGIVLHKKFRQFSIRLVASPR